MSNNSRQDQSHSYLEVACLGVEEVNDDIAVVEEHPAAIVGAFSTKGSFTEFAELHLDIIRERTDVAVGRARSDHEDVGHHEEIRDVEKGNVVALLVEDCISSGPRCGFGVRSGWDGDSFFLGASILGAGRREVTKSILA